LGGKLGCFAGGSRGCGGGAFLDSQHVTAATLGARVQWCGGRESAGISPVAGMTNFLKEK
jgi:hypothetical protein